MVFAALIVTPAIAGNVLTASDLVGAYQERSYPGRVTVHDPAIFMDNISNPGSPRYYIYGSHMARAYTSSSLNFQSWTNYPQWTDCNQDEINENVSKSMFADANGNRVSFANAYNTNAVKQVKNYNGDLVTFGNFNAHSWQRTGNTVAGNQWAPDIVYNKKMKKWCMYMSVNGDQWCSSIVLLTSDSPEGPWVYQGPVVFSGFNTQFVHNGFQASEAYKHTDLEIAIGTQAALPQRYNVSAWQTCWPNCIDACVFYDEQGKLWMSYGSWFGGIFMFELDEETGLREYTVHYPYTVYDSTNKVYVDIDPATNPASDESCISDPYFGKKIAGGYQVSGEASYIQYFNGYYYLWLSNGGFASDGGYQMRVYRSTNPDGPYTDPWGLDAKPGKNVTNYGANTGRDYGVKLFGGYKWDTMPLGELAQGHNSAIVTHDGHLLLVNHTRYNDGTEHHQVRVHEVFQTQDGWLVASPYEYDGETVTQQQINSTQLFTAEQVAGDYQIMIHLFRQNTANRDVVTPVTIHLNADGTISGAYTGSWSLVPGTTYINVQLNNILGSGINSTFHGVLTEQTIDYSNVKALCFTVCGTKKNECAQVANKAALTTSGLCIWGSKADAKAAIAKTVESLSIGNVTRTDLTLPTEGQLGASISWTSADESIITSTGLVGEIGKTTLTATISKDGYTFQKEFPMTVAGNEPTTYKPESDLHTTTLGWWQVFSKDYYKLNAGETCKFEFYNYSGKTNNWSNWVLVAANNGTRDENQGYKEYLALRADNYGWGDAYNANNLSNTYDMNTFKEDMDGAFVEMTCSYGNDGKLTMDAVITTKTNKTLTYSYFNNIPNTPSDITLFFTNENSYITQVPPTATYYPESEKHTLDAAYLQNFSTENYYLTAGNECTFDFYNYSDKSTNWCNWALGGYEESRMGTNYFIIRADNWENVAGNNGGCNSNFNWGTFTEDMDGSHVVMNCKLETYGQFTMNATITTKAGKIYTYSYQKTLTTQQAYLCLAFINQQSHICQIAPGTSSTFYPESAVKNLTTAHWTNFTEGYTLHAGNTVNLRFFNLSNKGANYKNWILAGATNDTRNADKGYKEYFALRSDHYGWGDAYTSGTLTSQYDWATFLDDMDGAYIDMTCTLDGTGKFISDSKIYTRTGKTLPYRFETTIPGNPAQMCLFFSNEGSFVAPSYEMVTDLNGTASEKGWDNVGLYVPEANNVLVTMDGNVSGNNVLVLDEDTKTYSCKDLVLTDGSPYIAPVAFNAESASYSRNMGNQWGTLVMPYALTASGDTHDFYELTSADGETLVLTKITSDILSAGTPVVVRRDAAVTGISLNEDNVQTVTAPTAGSNASGLTLVGSFNSTDITNEDGFIINSNKFWSISDIKSLADGGVFVSPFRAYLRGTVNGNSSAKALNIRINDETTAIETLDAIVNDNADFYDVNGMRTNGLKQGVNIVKFGNGQTRKVIIK